MALLKVDCLYKWFGGVHAVEDVSFGVEQGWIYAIIGPNGAGKTTLFNLITGMYPADKGAVSLGGRDITALRAFHRTALGIGRTFQNLMLFRQLSVWENVMVGFHCRTKSSFVEALLRTRGAQEEWNRSREKVCEILDFVGLSERLDNRAGSLSYGLQKRLEIARALATSPRVLLLDEPAAGLNTQDLGDLVRIIRAIRDRGITVLLIEHKMDVVMSVSDRVMVLNFGQKIAEGTPTEVSNNPAVIEAYLGRGA